MRHKHKFGNAPGRAFESKQLNYQRFLNAISKKEASGNQRLWVKIGTSWYMNGTRNLDSICAFGIVSPENPNGKEAAADDNLKYLSEFRNELRVFRAVCAPIDGHSFLVFNLPQRKLEYLAAKFEQVGYLYCYPENENNVVAEYYAKRESCANWDARTNPYEFVCKTMLCTNGEIMKDSFSVICGDCKFILRSSVFDEVAAKFDENIKVIMQKTGFSYYQVLDWATNRVGQKAYYINLMLNNGMFTIIP